MKNMMRSLFEEFPDAWDETLPWVLFAYREVSVETLGFSTFDLMLAHKVNGPLALVKKAWLFSNGHMPFGLWNTSATFSQSVQKLLRGLGEFAFAYLDDILVASDSWEERLVQFRQVFDRI